MNFDVTKLTKQIDEVIGYLSQKLEIPVAKALEILHKEYIYRLCMDGIWFIIGMALAIGGYKFIKSIWKTDDKGVYELDDEEARFWLTFFSGIGEIISIAIILRNANLLLHGLINPEWYIYMEIIKPMLPQ